MSNTQAIRDRVERLKRVRVEAYPGEWMPGVDQPEWREYLPGNRAFVCSAANEWSRILQDLETACMALERECCCGGDLRMYDKNALCDACSALATIARVDGGAG